MLQGDSGPETRGTQVNQPPAGMAGRLNHPSRILLVHFLSLFMGSLARFDFAFF